MMLKQKNQLLMNTSVDVDIMNVNGNLYLYLLFFGRGWSPISIILYRENRE